MSTYKYTQKLTPQQRRARAQVLAAQRQAATLNKTREGTYRPSAASTDTKRISDANIALKSAATVGDLTANVLIGALKSLEGIYDLGAGIVGTVGGIFSDGFRNDVQNHIKYDAVGSWIGDPLDRLFKDSYLEDSKAGQITEEVIQGVGQMLPAVAVSVATSGLASGTMASAGTATAAQIAEAASKAGQVAALTTMGVSAAGNATEEAYREGADYGEGLAYGTLTGAVEVGTEMLTDGLTKNLYGAGALDKLGKSAVKETSEEAAKSSAKVGAKRVIKGMVEEGAEEALSELASPALKSIYKGKDALKEYGESEYRAGVVESALVGSLTSAVYSGTVGKIRGLGGASGIENDANAVLEDITEQKRRARKLAAKGKLTREQAINIEKTVKADMELLEKQLIKASDKSRAKALEGGLSLNFDEKGNLRPEIRKILDKNIAAATDTTYDHRYRSIDLDADTITKTLERTGTTAFSGEMDAEQKANLNEFTRMFNAASDLSGGTMRFIVTNEMTNDNAMWVNDKGIMMISADTLRSGDSTTLLAQKLISDTFIESTVHEVKHAIDGTHSSSLLDEHLMSNDDVYSKAISEYLARGYSEEYLGKNRAKAAETLKDIVERGRADKQLSANERAVFEEFEREWSAFASQQVLGTKEFARHLVKNDLGTVEKILGKLQDIKMILKSRENPDAKKAADFVKKAERLYINALEEIGAKYVDNKIIGVNDEKEESYQDVDKKRIQSWLNVNRLQLPLHNLDLDSANSISQIDEKSISFEKKVSDNIQHSRKPTAQEGLNKQADYWHNKYDRATEQIKIRGRILSIAHKIKDLKTGAYVNAAQYKSDIFKHTVEKLGMIEFRGNFNNTGTRAIIKNLNEWYDDKNNLLYRGADASSGSVGRFNYEIKQMMSAIADGSGAFTTQELLSIEKILSYFAGEIQSYNTIIRNGKRVDAKPIAERHIKTAEEAQAIKIKCGAIRAISRSPFAVMVADPATLMRQADGYRNGFFTEMFNELREGEIKSSVTEAELTNEFREFWNKNKAYSKRYNKATVKVNGADIPLRHAISLYMTYQRKQAQAGLVYSGFDILDGDKKITVYKGNDTKLNEKQITDISKKRADELKAQFNEKDLELVSVMERAFEECRKLKIDVDMALKHYTNVDNSGYYFPIRRSQIAQNIDMFSIFEGDRVSNLSMNKDIVKGAKNALLIEPVDIVFMRHIKATSLYSGLGIFTDNFNRLYNLNVNTIEKELSFKVKNDVKKSFGFNSINDYVGVQKAVISTLSSEGFFDNNVIVNKDSGMEIEITKDGIKETLGPDMRFEKLPRKLKELKLLTLRILPTLIEEAKLADSDVNNIHTKQSKLKYSYLSQEITISNETHKEKYTISIAVRKSKQKNKFWIHEIRATKKEQNLIPSGDIRPQQGYNEVRAPSSIISLDGAFVNSKIENSDYNRPKTIKSTLEFDKFSKAMTEYFTEIKKDIEGISTKEQSTKFFNDAVGYIRSAYAKYQLGANPKVWFTQLSSFFAATNILDYNSIIKGLGVKNKASEVDKYCRLAWLRNMDNTAVKAQSVTDKIGKIGDVLTAPIGWMDRGVVTELFGACQIQVQKDQKLTVGTEENKRAAGELLQKVILETQQNSLASERSAMMRSNDNLKKSFTMFSADSMKIFSRMVDAFGEREVIRTLIKNESDAKKRAEYEAQLKKVDKSCRRSVSALITSSIFVAAIAQGFKWWYRRDEDESLGTFTADVIGNMLGGLPLIRDIYSYFADGYEVNNFLISTFNDVLKASLEAWELSADIVSGKDVSQQEIAGSVRKMLYASGQILGIPTRNIYNFTTGNINRLFPATGYKIENIFYKQAYRADLAKAIENDDENMISAIAGLILNENVGGIDSKVARTELDRLIGAGFDVLPRGISSTVTYNGETYELNAKQKKAFSKVYEIANDALGDMVKLARYKEASDEVKAGAIRYVYNTYYNLALQNFLGEDLETKTVLFAEAIDIEKLALIITSAQYITADTDNNGKAISGSRKRKIQAYINSLSLKAAEKYMIMGYLGYKNINGEAHVKAYINTLSLTKQEKSRLLEYSGYAA